MKDARTFWDKTAAKYAKSPVRNEAVYQQKLAITREYLQPDWSVLEFGCGTGSTALVHAPHVKLIMATDISDRMLEIARQKAADAGIGNVVFQQGTLDTLDLESGSFDAVLGLNILHLLEDVDGALAQVHRLLKPGGIFVSSTALIGDLNPLWRLLIPVMQAVGLAPHVASLGRQDLLTRMEAAGFHIERQWQPDKMSIFVIASKGI